MLRYKLGSQTSTCVTTWLSILRRTALKEVGERHGNRGRKRQRKERDPPAEIGNICPNPGKLMGKEKHPLI